MDACCVEAARPGTALEGAYLRPIAFMGDGAMGLGAINPTRMAITAWDWGAYLGDKGLKDGIRGKVSSFTRMHVNVNMVRGKITGQYVNSILAKREAVLAGYDEAILLDISGFVTEASGENIFMVSKNGTIRTPPLSSPILNGITRDAVIKMLRNSGRDVYEVTFTRDALYIAEEVFLTGTAAEVTPVREVDNRQVGRHRGDHPLGAGALLPGGAGHEPKYPDGSPTSEGRRRSALIDAGHRAALEPGPPGRPSVGRRPPRVDR